MSKSPYTSDQDKLERYINAFATQSFRDQADRDYIAARLACRYELMPQFLWASQQAIEKYLKAILLYNRIEATNVRHKLAEAMILTKRLSFPMELSPRSQSFFDYLCEYGEYRYIDIPYYVDGFVMIDLDLLVWEIRRYCQVLNVFGKALPADEQVCLDKANDALLRSSSEPKYKFRLSDGLIEKILDEKAHPSRPALLWNNPVYGVRKRSTVRAREHIHAQNPWLYLYPEMLDELLRYVYIPKGLIAGYRSLLAKIKADPSARP